MLFHIKKENSIKNGQDTQKLSVELQTFIDPITRANKHPMKDW